MNRMKSCFAMAGALAMGACVLPPPAGPSVMVLPARGKSFAQFQQDDATCRQFASQQIGNASPADAAAQAGVASAAVGTVVGAAAGAAIGAAAGNPALGAAIGAGSGLAVGSAAGAGAAQYSGAAAQQRYDMGYMQCMAANGESVPPPQALAAEPYAAAYPAYPGYYDPYYYPYPAFYGPAYYGDVVVGGGWGGGWGRGGGWHR